MQGNRQLTIYENAVNSSVGNVMILPVPNTIPIHLVDLSKSNWDWFQIQKTYFPEKRRQVYAFGSESAGWGMQEKVALPVVQCGGYQVTITPTLEDMCRVDTSVFKLPKDIENVLKVHYATGFSFIVCKFERGRTAGHPIAYVHGLLPNGSLFIPTRHEHGTSDVAESSNKPVHHEGVRCDGCGAFPIEGPRWKCQTCADFDFCDQCFRNDKERHRSRHFFSLLEKDMQSYDTRTQFSHASYFEGFEGPRVGAHMDFDHTIYLFNCMLQAGPRAVTKSKFAKIEKITGFMPEFLRNVLQASMLLCVQRVEIKGDRASQYHDIQNGDYLAAPVQK
ncbi:MAG: hypothetical protein K2Q45_00435 [Nitrosomonas sp.]|nr:hypothetical protein [Nitrosomonas sp.]